MPIKPTYKELEQQIRELTKTESELRKSEARFIAEREQVAKSLRHSVYHHRTLVETIPDLIWLKDQDGVYISCNPTFERFFGAKEAEIIGKTDYDFVNKELAASFRHHDNKAMEANGPSANEEWLRFSDGGYHGLFETIKSPMHDREGTLIGVLGIARDITERKQIEKDLRESEARFRSLHNASFGGIAIHDKGVILECNQGLSVITGYSVGELIGMDGLALIAKQSRDLVMQNILDGFEHRYEAVGLRKNGEEFPLYLEARNVPYKGKQVRTVEFRDITETKQAEQEQAKLQAQLVQAQKMEAVGRLAGGVAHDFNNMLGVIIGHVDMAIEDVDQTHPILADLKEIKNASERSAELIRQLLAFARKQTVSPKVLDLNQTVKGMTKMLQRLIGENIELTLIPEENIWSVKIDPSQIDQIMANLCVNARDAITGVGKITIETGTIKLGENDQTEFTEFIPGDYVLLVVSDNGSGIDSETLKNIFEPFFTTKESSKGTGLGLATVYGIVRQNNGFIRVYSEPGHGTTIKIYLPRHETNSADLSQKESEKMVESGNETILLVEDEPAILNMTRRILEKLGYTVVTANTPGKAIHLASSHSDEIHLLLTDVIMPEMNGRDMARKILSFHPKIKRLFMSGYTANVIAHQGILEEEVNFIHKPFSKHDLALKIRQILDNK